MDEFLSVRFDLYIVFKIYDVFRCKGEEMNKFALRVAAGEDKRGNYILYVWNNFFLIYREEWDTANISGGGGILKVIRRPTHSPDIYKHPYRVISLTIKPSDCPWNNLDGALNKPNDTSSPEKKVPT